MASKPLRFHTQAEEEYLAALSWYQQRSSIAATNFENNFIHSVERIIEAPERWPIYFQDFRKYTLHQFPFSIIYQITPKEIVVFAIAHGSRMPGYWRVRK
jgi:toxin ParE1/3/4